MYMLKGFHVVRVNEDIDNLIKQLRQHIFVESNVTENEWERRRQ